MVRLTHIAMVAVSALAGADAFAATHAGALSRAALPRALRSAPPAWRTGRASNCAISMLETEQKEAEGLGFDSHQAVNAAPDMLCLDGTANTEMRAKFEKMCREAQDKICKAVEDVDGKGKFHQDSWVRENGGGGISRVLTNGNVFEKAGCSLSVVYGSMPQEALAAANDRLKFGATDRGKGYKPGEKVPFFACGLSSVMHPRNPHCPTMHFNYRYFETEGGMWWFGGGTDITPAYLDLDDMKHFHGSYKEVADKHDPEFYPKYYFLPTNTLRIATPDRVLCMRVITPGLLGAPKLPRAIRACPNACRKISRGFAGGLSGGLSGVYLYLNLSPTLMARHLSLAAACPADT